MRMLIASFLLMPLTGFATTIVFDNQTSYPLKTAKSRLAIQWARTTKEMQEANKALIYGTKLDLNALKMVLNAGKLRLKVPNNAEHFRVLAWSNDAKMPDLLTNWVDVVPDKTYKLEKDQLTLAVLMSGVGC